MFYNLHKRGPFCFVLEAAAQGPFLALTWEKEPVWKEQALSAYLNPS
jgi:hypothetical protein